MVDSMGGPFLFAMWDGVALVRCATIEHLQELHLAASYRLRIADLRAMRKPYADTMAKAGDCSDGYYARAIANIDREIEELEKQ